MKAEEKVRRLVMAALFAAAITVVTAYVLHIPAPTGGYVHLGDALIYLAACLLPGPYAVGCAAIGAGLADLLTAPVWVLPTLVIKSVVALLFTAKGDKIMGIRNIIGVFVAGILSPALYGLAWSWMSGSLGAFAPQFLATLVQGVGSGVVFAVLALALDGVGVKKRLSLVQKGC